MNYCFLPSSYYVLILMNFFFLPLHCDYFQIRISSTGLYLEFYTYIYNYFQAISTWFSIRSHLAKTEHRLSSCSFCPPQTSRWHLHQLSSSSQNSWNYPRSLYFLYIHIQSISRFCWAISQSIHHSICMIHSLVSVTITSYLDHYEVC